MTLYAITKKLIGPITPIGDSNVDRDRLENLKAMMHLVEGLLFDIGNVSAFANSHEASVKKAGETALKFLRDIGDAGIPSP